MSFPKAPFICCFLVTAFALVIASCSGSSQSDDDANASLARSDVEDVGQGTDTLTVEVIPEQIDSGCKSNEDCAKYRADYGQCQVPMCDVDSGQCQPAPAPAGTACDDGDECTENDQCDGATCSPGLNVCGECGDNECNGEEQCFDCPQDCGACPWECGDGKCTGDEGCHNCMEDCKVCGDDDCCTEHAPTGCGDADIMACVCKKLPFCCQGNWDDECVAGIEQHGCGNCPTQ